MWAPQGIIDAAQMAQAASALQQSVQQSGLGPYFMQQTYAPQLAQAQLQQVCSLLFCSIEAKLELHLSCTCLFGCAAAISCALLLVCLRSRASLPART